MARRPSPRTATQRASGQGVVNQAATRGASQRTRNMEPDVSGTRPAADEATVLNEALKRANDAWTIERNNVAEGRDCQRFYAGGAAQWDSKAYIERTRKNRPTLTVNRLPQFVKQLTGDIRKNPPSLKFLPAKGKASQETAEAYTGIARHIEQQSNAKDCYVQAVENAAQAGQGFWRVVTEYSSDDAFDLDIRIRPIRDPFGALLDPYATLFDKSDMKYAFVFEHVGFDDFKEMYPDAPAVSVPGGGDTAKVFPWRVGNTVRIAEYWRKVPVKKTLYLLPDGSTTDDTEDLAKAFGDVPGVEVDIKGMIRAGIIRSREVETDKVEMYKMTGGAILSGPHEWPGRYIPICMVVGDEITLDGNTVRKGMVHDARDPQRIYNYSRSASVEAVALQPKAPFIGTVDQFKGRPEWATAGSENHAFLAYNPDPRAANAAPQRAQPALAATGLDAQAMIAADDMKSVTGIYDASLGARSNETAGIAIAARQKEGDTATFMYVDNLARAMGYAGRILADLIPRVYDTERQVRILKEDGAADIITVNKRLPPGVEPESEDAEELHPLLDLSAGEYDVVVTTGPSFATQRQEAAANMVEMVRAAPQLMGIAGDLLLANMDWPQSDEIAKRMRKAMGIPDEGEPPPPPPPPNPKDAAAAMRDAAQADKTKAEAVGQEITNAQMLMQMQMTLQSIQQLLAGGAPMGGPGGAPPVPGSPMAPPPAPAPMGQGALPPMVEMQGEMPGEPPMVELSDVGGFGPV